MSAVASVRETTLAPRSRESAVSVALRFALGTLSWNEALPFAFPAAVTLELLTIPFSKPITLNTCWATSSIRRAVVVSWIWADWTTWRLPDGTGAGAAVGAATPAEADVLDSAGADKAPFAEDAADAAARWAFGRSALYAGGVVAAALLLLAAADAPANAAEE